MALLINADCTSCHICVPECPNEAISVGPEIYLIDPNLCTECVGFHNTPQCAAVCPVDSCVTDPERPETEAELFAKAKSIHPENSFSGDLVSHHRSKK